MHDNKTPASGLTREAINHLQDFLVPGGPTEIIVAKGSAGALVAECDPDGLPLQVVEHPGHPDILDLITNPLHDHFLVWERCVILNQPGPEENPRHVAIGIVGLQGIDLFVPPSVFADWFRESMDSMEREMPPQADCVAVTVLDGDQTLAGTCEGILESDSLAAEGLSATRYRFEQHTGVLICSEDEENGVKSREILGFHFD